MHVKKQGLMTFQILKNFAISFPDVGHEGSYVEMVERFTSRNKAFNGFCK